MIDQARAILEAPAAEQQDRILHRLRAVHGDGLTWEELTSLPLVDRTKLVASAREIAEAGRRDRGIEVRRTSGSSGTPFVFPKDRVMTAWMDAAMWAVYSWHGVEPGAPHARFWGAPLDAGKRRQQAIFDRLLHRRRISGFELSPENVFDHFTALRDLSPDYAYGYPTLMRAFTNLCRAGGLDGRDLGFRVVISTGEILSPDVRTALRDFFGCPVVNEYGCTESGIVGFECEYGQMHSIPVAVSSEVVDEVGSPVSAGEEGEVAISDLYGKTMPLLRYRLHDRARMGAATCPCGRDLPQLTITSGRSDSFIETPRGKVYDAILAYTVPAEVQRFRARQTAPDHLHVEVVPGIDFDPEATPAQCRHEWQEVLGPGMTVTVETVPEIPLEPSGKLRYFIPLDP